MPIVDVLVVCSNSGELPADAATSIANALGAVLAAEPGRVWVRLETLPSTQYAENHTVVPAEVLPVFVTLLHAKLPGGTDRQQEALAVCLAIASCLGRAREQVHLEYAAAGWGRVAFGGRLLS